MARCAHWQSRSTNPEAAGCRVQGSERMKSRLSFKRREPFATSCVPIGARASAMKIGRREIPGSIAVFIRGWVARRAGTIAGRLERGSQRYVAQPFLKGMRQGAPPSIAIFAPDALRSSARVWSRYFRPWPCAPPTELPPRRRYRRMRFAIRAPPRSGEAIDRRHRSRGADFQTRRRHDRAIEL